MNYKCSITQRNVLFHPWNYYCNWYCKCGSYHACLPYGRRVLFHARVLQLTQLLESRVVVVVRALAFHQYGPDLISWPPSHMWTEFVASLLCSESFSSFPFSSKTNIWFVISSIFISHYLAKPIEIIIVIYCFQGQITGTSKLEEGSLDVNGVAASTSPDGIVIE